MESKSKSEKLIFWGFVFLAISFIGMVYYFSHQNDLLEERRKEIAIQKSELKLERIAAAETSKKNMEVLTKIKSLNPELSNKIDTLAIKASQSVKTDITKIAIEQGFAKSVVYVQVGSNATKLDLKNKDFISKLNANGFNVINAYDLEEGKADNSIRYFNKGDENLADNLKKAIEKEFPEIVLESKFVRLKTKVPNGQIEIWVK
ncbi:hypothetical protein QQY79_08180 [Flavobacterium tructae]|uniref:hypothetical protein n=1 Tax=Flavobacterium tructae TaxID=1114873 RepID=UPI0025520C81|nr:hypothetical protein [Flavobacterium tructae]MDL2142495.1 hypothetical protein [Flavobacterium tructae]